MAKIKTLSIDIETRSSVDLGKCGVYKYASSPDFAILLFGVSVNGGPITVYDLACGESIPEDILVALTDDSVIKWAFNSSFERVCLSRYLSDYGMSLYPFHDNYEMSTEMARYLNPESWRCSMVWSAYMGLPLSLEAVGAVLGFEEQKLKEGKELIRYFCVPCKPTKSNGGRTWNLPEHAPEKWELFKKYNIRDVQVEMQIQARLKNYPVPDFVWDEYHIDQEINDRGIMIDRRFVEQALIMDDRSKTDLMERLQRMTGLENPNSVVQLKDYLSEHGLEAESLGKKDVAAMIKTAPADIAEVLSLRLQLAKSSVKKYQAMMNSACDDDRCHGMFFFYGANRTGRFAGRIVQLQNLPQNHIPDLAEARSLVKCGDYDALEMLYENVPEVLSELIRTAFVPKPGYKFIVSDFSAIEARVLSWLAGEQWRMQTFAEGGDIYCATAERMFHCRVVKHGENGELRQKGKQCELSCGYGGSVGALKAMGALEAGMQEDELKPLVDAWRSANPKIVELWWDVDRAVMKTVRERVSTRVKNIRFSWKSGMLFITLPSGRQLAYVKPRIGENQFGGDCVTYMGVGGTKKWERLESYGPKFVENIVQAISRDILMYAMKTLRCCSIVAHVHDELIIEADKRMSLDAVCEQMGRTPPWAEGLLLRADGYETDFYKKD